MRKAEHKTQSSELIERLNRLSLTHSFTPQVDVDWSAATTDEEFRALYDSWSLLAGTGLDAGFDDRARADFARYQQANLMLFTALLERHGITALAKLYDLDPDREFRDYVGHFIKEEIYHYSLFTRAIEALYAQMPDRAPLLPTPIDRAMRLTFAVLGALPGARLRYTLLFSLFRFAEQVTIHAHQVVSQQVPRRESLVAQVWAFHAQDEARHIAFDGLVLERCRLRPPVSWLARGILATCCVSLSLLLNAAELRAARLLGAPVGLWRLPGLMRGARAPFKRRVFGLLGATLRGLDPA